MLDIEEIIIDSARRGHRAICDDVESCAGPNEKEVLVAAVVLNSALPELFYSITQEVNAVAKAIEAGQFEKGSPDATDTSAEALLRDWFHWWRTDESAPAKMPDGLHVKTVAYLTVQAVEAGRTVRGPADV